MSIDLQPLATQDDLAAMLGAPRSTVEHLHRAKKWPHVRVGKRIRYTREQVEQIVTQHTVTPAKDEKRLPGQTARSASRKAAS